jgi:hypothetical protein
VALEKSRKVVIIPDNWGSLRLLKELKDVGRKPPVLLGGAASLPYACRLSGPARVNVLGIRDPGAVPLAAIPSERTRDLVGELKRFFYETGGSAKQHKLPHTPSSNPTESR